MYRVRTQHRLNLNIPRRGPKQKESYRDGNRHMKPRYQLVVIAIAFVASCSDTPKETQPTVNAQATSVSPAVAMRKVTPAPNVIADAPVLRKKVPSNALAYLRVPNLWALLAAPSGSVFDKATGSAPFFTATQSIRQGLGQLIDEDAPPELKQLLKLLFAHARAPIELVPMSPATTGVPIPDLLLSTTLDFATTAELDSFFAKIFAGSPAIASLAATDDNGSGTFSVAGMPVMYNFDPTSRRIYLFSGAGAQPGAMATLLDGLIENTDHPMYKHESVVDASGQGLFLWVDTQSLMTYLDSLGQQHVGLLRAFGGNELKALVLGVGTSGGMHRAKFIVEMPRTGFRAFVPDIRTDIKFSGAGKVSGLGMFALPNPADIAYIETTAVGMMGGDQFDKYRDFKQKLRLELGFGLEEIFDAVGPELLSVFDQAGEYVALRVRDKAKLQKILDALNDKYKLERGTNIINGVTYHHYVIPTIASLGAQKEEQSPDPKMPAFLVQALKAPSHIYWSAEGDYLLLSSVPQILIDRSYIASRTDIKSWLAIEQRVDATHALLLASNRSEGTPRFMYNLNLQLLEFLGDVTHRPIDLFSFPSAREANIPEFGAYSFQANTSANSMSLELSFENNPGEIFFAGSGLMTSAATAGILAAIAIPAYQDYTVRAKVSQGIVAAWPLKNSVYERYTQKKKFLSEKQASLIISEITSEVLDGITYDAKTGEITLIYNLPSMDIENTLTFTPNVSDNGITWRCSGTIKNTWRPKDCRDPN